jgi:Na+-transporting methylmalonyl-CoA/oxaloacetate decarboxylase gamma subunit
VIAIGVGLIVLVLAVVVYIVKQYSQVIKGISDNQANTIEKISQGFERAHTANSQERADLADRLMETVGVYHMSQASQNQIYEQQQEAVMRNEKNRLYKTEEEEDDEWEKEALEDFAKEHGQLLSHFMPHLEADED